MGDVGYRVVSTSLLHKVDLIRGTDCERVMVTALDEEGEMIQWTAQIGRVPKIGTLFAVSMEPTQENPPTDA